MHWIYSKNTSVSRCQQSCPEKNPKTTKINQEIRPKYLFFRFMTVEYPPPAVGR
jgi:hypothetical protein